MDEDEVLATGEERPVPAATSPWRVVVGLSALNVLSYVDRQLLSAVAPLLIEDLGLSLAQIGLLLGISFMLVYAAGTLVVGVLADRWSRPRLMAGGLTAWSAATALTGTATGFGPLAVWRALVGIGEATVPATAVSMIGDRVPTERVGLANGVFYAGIPVGFAISFALAGLVAPALGWRACFLGLGAAGLVAVCLVFRMADPPRRGVVVRSSGGAVATVSRMGRALLARPSLLLVILAGTLLVWASASSQHAITWLVQERGFAFRPAAFYSAAILLLAGLTGSLGIGALTDRARRRRPGARLVALATLGAVGLAAALTFYRTAPGSFLFLSAWFLAEAWLLGWFGPLLAAIDEMAPAGSRAGALGFGLLVINVVGVAGGPYVTGVIGDRYDLTTGLTWSLVPAAVGVVLVGLVGLFDRRS